VRRGALPSENLVHLDDDLLVVNKPAGLLSVPFEPGDRDTLLSQAITALGARGRQGDELGAVHRLDIGTSGLMVFTRNLHAKRVLQEQFRAHTVERRYLAIAHGAVLDATHDTWLIDDRGDGIRGSFGVFRRPRGPRPAAARQAITHVHLLEGRKTTSLIECRLETGRQHQIRIHLSESNHPLLGEQVYIRDFAGPKIGAPRPMLHSHVLGFTHPRSGEIMRFQVAPPSDFELVLSRT
jgi:23S rRNA pseudouridine1911/1915/1917 synthase